GTIPLTVSVMRPDKQVIELFSTSLYNLSENEPIRISILNSSRDSALSFVREFESEENFGNIQTMSAGVTEIIFSEAKPGFVQNQIPLKGNYIFEIKVSQPIAEEGQEIPKVYFEEPHISVVGRVSGLLGTDNSERDIFSGIIAGLKWALLIGFFTSIISVFVGVIYGIITAYFGGKVDSAMMFFWDYFISLPVLPILIVAAAIFKPSIWTLVGVLIVFSWAGSVKTVRSIALQIKEETFVEAARALGASHGRIIFRHMAPILIPYSFASMALAVPGAIIYESTVSLLGLGDTTVVTWGQILNDAYQGQAMLTGLWWWIIPPGLAIAIIGMTFAFLGFALDRILHPKLQTR
ncbi:MAG TPA: ABC transporter permease, partial [Spirochaetales bacterium]|nr:ABC transporter permease [Spirochaetales bacterium]